MFTLGLDFGTNSVQAVLINDLWRGAPLHQRLWRGCIPAVVKRLPARKYPRMFRFRWSHREFAMRAKTG